MLQIIFDATGKEKRRFISDKPLENWCEKGETEVIVTEQGVISRLATEDVELHDGDLVFSAKPDDYCVLRAAAYPSIGDQLNALWKRLTRQSVAKRKQ